jgi:hypothetical protein
MPAAGKHDFSCQIGQDAIREIISSNFSGTEPS